MGLGCAGEDDGDLRVGSKETPYELMDVEELTSHADEDASADSLYSSVATQSPPVCEAKGEQNEAGVCGLLNLGNTCFMSAGVQCLVATPPLTRALLAAPLAPHHLTQDLADLTRQIWSGQFSAVQPLRFKESLGKQYPQFNDFGQHDCQEFLALLLDGLHEQMNAVNKKEIASQNEHKYKLCDNVKVVNEENKNSDDFRDPYSPSAKNGKVNNVFPEPILIKPGTSASKSDLASGDAHSSGEESVSSSENKNDTAPNLNNAVQFAEISSSSENNSGNWRPPLSPGELNNMAKMISKVDNTSLGLNNSLSSLDSREVLDTTNSLVRSLSQLSNFDDIIKHSKTSNVNVLGKEVPAQAANNSIRFDSEKFPRVDNIKKKQSFTTNPIGWAGKRLTDDRVGLDLKRIKLDDDDDDKNTRPDPPSPHHFLEKNIRLECEMKERSTEGTQAGESQWQCHLATNSSVIVNTFQGQLKSQVVCSICEYVSITYEPFMYLSVPLPNAMKKHIKVTFVENKAAPVKVVLEMNKTDTVSCLKEKLISTLNFKSSGTLIVGEVFNNHIAKLLDDSSFVSSINDANRDIYVFDVITLCDEKSVTDMSVETHQENSEEVEMTCHICLEDKDVNIKKHVTCTFVICDNCIKSSCTHMGAMTFNCPVCNFRMNISTDLVSVSPPTTVKIRLVKVSLVYRLEDEGLIGMPSLVQVPNRCQAEWLRTAIAEYLPFSVPFSLLIVDGQGLRCGRCMYSTHCRGCALEGAVRLSAGETLAVCVSAQPPLPSPVHHPTFTPSASASLTIYDCINAFSQSEVLDENDPWFCPNCKKNQCATKTLSIWRYPDYLIVYLKRFVFHEQSSTKLDERVEFPVKGLKFPNSLIYDLYACVCHFGGISAGHYTTYTLHSQTENWHYYNDSLVSKQTPSEVDFSSAYILFYKKRSL